MDTLLLSQWLAPLCLISLAFFIFGPICSLQKLVAQHGTETFTTTEFKFVKIHSLKLLGFFFTDAVLTLAA